LESARMVSVLAQPPVLVLFSNALAGWVVVVGAEIERVNSPRIPMDQRERQCSRHAVEAPVHLKWIAHVRRDLHPELHRWRMVVVLGPAQISDDSLRRIRENDLNLGLGDRNWAPPG